MPSEMIFTLIAYVISFGMTFFLMPSWIRHAIKINLVGRDMHKTENQMIPEAGGVIVLTAITVSLLYYGGIQAFFFHHEDSLTMIFGAIGSLLLVGIIGIMDDFGGWKRGLKQWQKPLLTLPAAIPFLLVNIHRTTMDFPFIGVKDIGLLFPLFFIPVAIAGASNAFNMLAGYNGLEAGMGMIILGTLSLLSLVNGQYLAVVFCLIGLFALFAFIIFNWYPSKIFPGDTMTYPIGAFIAICAILGMVEKFALILFIPYYLDFLLPLRKRMKVEAFAKINSDGSFETPYDSIYDSTHLVIFVLKRFRKRVDEKDVVLTILGFELLLAAFCVVVALL